MSQEIDTIQRLEQIVTALAGFVSTMPQAPMMDPAVARDRMAAILEAVRDPSLSVQDVTDKLFDLLRQGPPSMGDPDQEARVFLARHLGAEFLPNPPDPSARRRPLDMILRDDGGEPLGGLTGSTAGAWLNIDQLWLPPEMRGAGRGTDLLRRAEAEAAQRGCAGAWLATIVERAVGFYERHGYQVEMTLENPPFGFTTRWLVKRGLDPAQA